MESDSGADLFWILLLWLYLALFAWLLFAWLRGDAQGGDSLESDPEPPTPTPASPKSIRGWLDQKATILISRRPKHRYHRKDRNPSA